MDMLLRVAPNAFKSRSNQCAKRTGQGMQKSFSRSATAWTLRWNVSMNPKKRLGTRSHRGTIVLRKDNPRKNPYRQFPHWRTRDATVADFRRRRLLPYPATALVVSECRVLTFTLRRVTSPWPANFAASVQSRFACVHARARTADTCRSTRRVPAFLLPSHRNSQSDGRRTSMGETVERACRVREVYVRWRATACVAAASFRRELSIDQRRDKSQRPPAGIAWHRTGSPEPIRGPVTPGRSRGGSRRLWRDSATTPWKRRGTFVEGESERAGNYITVVFLNGESTRASRRRVAPTPLATVERSPYLPWPLGLSPFDCRWIIGW